MSLYDLWRRLTNEAVDPAGWGVPHNTGVNRATNRLKATSQVIKEIEARTGRWQTHMAAPSGTPSQGDVGIGWPGHGRDNSYRLQQARRGTWNSTDDQQQLS